MPLVTVPCKSIQRLLGHTRHEHLLRQFLREHLQGGPRRSSEMTTVSKGIVGSTSSQEVDQSPYGPRGQTNGKAPRSTPKKGASERFFARCVQERSVEVEVRCDLAHAMSTRPSHMGVASSTLGDDVMSNLSVHATPCSVILPPRQSISQVPRNEETNFPRSEAMISHGAIVGQFSHNGLR